MKKTYMQPTVAIEDMELEEMIAASTGITLNANGEIESIVGGSDYTGDGSNILSTEQDTDFFD